MQADRLLCPVLTLRHLAYLSEVNYRLLRNVVTRSEPAAYRVFKIKKRALVAGKVRYRTICVPIPPLQRAQTWIAQNILAHAKPHSASTAYSKGNSIREAAMPHCGSTWLIKLDLENFFESISEISVYRVFRQLGYQPLPSFEMTRICTRSVPKSRWTRYRSEKRLYTIEQYDSRLIGSLPQGAPTSPMLSNLAMFQLDEAISSITFKWGLRYTRFGDDISISTHGTFDKPSARAVICEVYKVITQYGLAPNRSKAAILGPGSRRIVVGLLVDGDTPRLSRKFKASLRLHLYYLTHPKIGPAAHARNRGFEAVAGLRHHIGGLIAYAQHIEPDYARERWMEFNSVSWPI